jgi:hypothetical protein
MLQLPANTFASCIQSSYIKLVLTLWLKLQQTKLPPRHECFCECPSECLVEREKVIPKLSGIKHLRLLSKALFESSEFLRNQLLKTIGPPTGVFDMVLETHNFLKAH